MPNAPPVARFERVAHRGLPRERAENTLPGFLLALDRGADAVELDTHVTQDGVVIVHHDDAVGGRSIAETDWRDLRDMDLGRGARIPRLDDVLDALGDRAAVYVELKGRRIEERVASVVRAQGRRFALHSFDHDAIARLAQLAPDLSRGILFDKATANPREALREAVARVHPRDVWPHWSLVDQRFVELAHELGTRVIVWTVNSAATARALVAQGVDAVCTDDVQILADI